MKAFFASVGDLLHLRQGSLMYLDLESRGWDICELDTIVILIAAHKWEATYFLECFMPNGIRFAYQHNFSEV